MFGPKQPLSTGVVQTPLRGADIPQFVERLPTFAGHRVSSSSFTVTMQEFQQKILPSSLYEKLSAPFNAGTYVWGYKVGQRAPFFPGYTVEAQHGTPTTITYVNNLPLPGKSELEKYLTIDQTIHWADPLGQKHMNVAMHMAGPRDPYRGPIPTVAHLHGAEVPSVCDGGPDQWFTPDGRHGKGYDTVTPTSPNACVFRYPNSQLATTLWFHDHALGITRINVFSGLAACYLLRDQYDTGRVDNPLGLPADDREVELLIQDRQFDINGQLLFPDGTPTDNPTGLNGPPPNPSIHPFWIPEFFGDAVVVNGMTWPYLDVKPQRYRFRIVNGSNARFYRMRLVDADTQAPGPVFWQIGTDGGLLDTPVMLNNPQTANQLELLLAPAERADIIVDFAGCEGHNFVLVNDAPAPYPSGGTPLDAKTNGRIMKFRVEKHSSGPDRTYDPTSGSPLRGRAHQAPAIVRLADPRTGTLPAGVKPTVKRQLVLVEVEGQGGPIQVLLNNTNWEGMREGTTTPIPGSQLVDGNYLTELPKVGATEEWEIINLTEDAHPIHVHLLQFQILNRQEVDTERYRAKYNSLFPGGTYSPGFGPPLPYTEPNASGALGGNPDVTPYLHDAITLPNANEAGWKDTIKVYPHGMTRIVLRWAPTPTAVDAVKVGQNLYPFDPTTGPGYVWHCHILDHEDNEMMRPYSPVS